MGEGEYIFRILSRIKAWNITEYKAELKKYTQRKGKSELEYTEKACCVCASRLELSSQNERLAHSQGSTVLPSPVPDATRTMTEATEGRRQDITLPAV